MDKDFGRIYAQYGEPLYYFILRMCGDEHLAKDILQDTMLRAMQSAEKFDGRCSVKTWLCTIAKNLYYDTRKRACSGELPLEAAGEIPDGADIAEQLARRDMAVHIHRLLHRIEEPYREVFTLRVFADLKFSEIGSVFGKNGNWAGVTFYRAKKKLIELMKEEGLI